MAFLTLNGLRIPCEADSPARGYEDAGRSSRAAGGQLNRDRRYVRRSWDVKLAPMTYADYKALRCWTTGRPLSFDLENAVSNPTYPNDILQTNAATLQNFQAAKGSDGLVVLPGARFGNYSAAPSVDGTNLWTANIASGTDTSSAVTGFSVLAGGTLTSDTTRAWQGSRSLKLVTAAANDGFRTAAYPNSLGRYTASFYVTGSAVAFKALLYAGTTLLGTLGFTPSPTAWTRLVVPLNGVAAPASSDLRIEVTQVGSGAAALYFDGLLLESTGQTTERLSPWMAGGTTRGGNSSQAVRTLTQGYLGSADGCTLNIWSTQPYGFGGYWARTMDFADSFQELAIVGSTQVGPTAFYNSLVPAAQARTKGGVYVTVPMPIAPTWPVGGWHMFTATLNPRPSSGEPSLALYMDGVLQGQAYDDLSNVNPAGFDYWWFGQSNGGNFLCAQIDEPSIWPCAMGPIAIKSLYDMNATLPTSWPILTASGDAIDSGDVLVQAKIDRADFLSFTDATASYNSGVQVALKLMEAG